MKRYIRIIISVFLVLSLFACGNPNESGNSTENTENQKQIYAYVDGQSVTSDEVEYFKGRLRGKILSDYTKKYGITDFSDFWDTEYGGVTPKNELQKEALTEAIRAKAELIEMKKQGIYDEISYDSLKNKAVAYNESRKNAPQTVGILSIDLTSFYTYYISNGEIKLKADEKINADFEKYVDGLVEKSTVEIVDG